MAGVGVWGCGGGESAPPSSPPRLGARLADRLAVAFTLDAEGIGVQLRGEVLPATPHDPAARPVLNGAPAHLVFEVPVASDTGGRALQVAAFPVGEYRRHYLGGARAGFDRRFGVLRDILAAGTQAVEGEIPIFPQPDADQRFRARVAWVRFGGGRGVAFVTHLTRDASPPQADELTWVFQGLSDDGAWLVSALQPLVVEGLPASEDPRRVAAAVEALPAEAFTPALDLMRRTVESLRLTATPVPER